MWFAILGFLFGITVGSFVKATSDRVVKSETVWGRSYCPHCQKRLRWYDLFPVFSYLALRGRCRYCRQSIPLDYLLTEVVLGLVTGFLFWLNIPSLSALSAAAFLPLLFQTFALTVFSLIFLIDASTCLIPDKIIYPAWAISAGYLVTVSALNSWVFYQGLLQHPLGPYLLPPRSGYLWVELQRVWWTPVLNLLTAAAAASFFTLLIVITRGRGMGWGDVKYILLIGLILGFPKTVVAIFLAFILGAVFSLALIVLRKKSFGQTIPFGPFLSIGATLAMLWGERLFSWYLHYFT